MRTDKKPLMEVNSRTELALVGLCILAFMLQALWGLKTQTATIDEFRHLPTGLYDLRTHDFSFDSKTPPFWKMICALPAYASKANLNLDPDWRMPRGGWGPWIFGTRFMMDNSARYDDYFYRAHALTILAAVFLMLLVYGWAKELTGTWAARGTLLLMAFSPTLLSNARLATPDVAVTFFMTATLYLLWRYGRSLSWIMLGGAGLNLGFALITKFTAVVLLPMVPLILLLEGWRRRDFKAALIRSAVVLALAGGIINLQYRFQGCGVRLGNLTAQSRLVQKLQASFVRSWPIPLPRPYLEGFDGQKADAETGEFPAFLNGRWSPQGWRYYYLVVFGLKEPIPFLVVLAIGVLLWPLRLKEKALPLWEIVLFCAVPSTLLIVLSFFNHLDVGIRYLLPAYPFLWIFGAGTIQMLLGGKRWGKGLLALLALGAVVSPFTAAPHYLAYFNQMAGGPSNGYQHLIDSNLDHGQELKDLKGFMDEHGVPRIQLAYFGHVWPQMYGINFELLGDHPKPGVVAISASFLQGMPYLLTYLPQPVYVPLNYYQTMRQYQPQAQIGYSIFIYNIPG
jgi:hypothetical protein